MQNVRTAFVAVVGWCLLGLLGLGGCQASITQSYSPQYVAFDDIAPSYLTLTQSWNALGLTQSDGEVHAYIIWTSTRDDGREDAALFRYTPASGKREFLGTFIDVATAQGNLQEGEQIPKGHTRILQVGRKLYMGSQGFHDFKEQIDELPSYRGAHLFSYDLDSGAFEDVSRNLPNGVLIEHQGIVSLAYMPERELLVGLAHPLGDIVLFDVHTNSVRKIVPGIPWELNHVVSREIVATRTGKIYTYRGPEEAVYRDQQNEVWVYDLDTDEMKPTGQLLSGGFWNGKLEAPDRNTVYLSTVSGELYQLDVLRGAFTHLGYFIDPADYNDANQLRVRYLYGINFSARDSSIVGVPIVATTLGPDTATDYARLTTYNLVTKQFTKQSDLEPAVFTGSEHTDRSGNIYMAAFDWNNNCKLGILKPSYTQSSHSSLLKTR
jgi:hypothetical protein